MLGVRRAGLQRCGTWSPHHQKFSLVVWITQVHVKQGSICYMPGGIQPNAVGIQRRENSHLTCVLPIGFWQSSCLYLSWGRNPDRHRPFRDSHWAGLWRKCMCNPPSLNCILPSGICLFLLFKSLQSNSMLQEPTSYRYNSFTFLFGKRERKKIDLKEW